MRYHFGVALVLQNAGLVPTQASHGLAVPLSIVMWISCKRTAANPEWVFISIVAGAKEVTPMDETLITDSHDYGTIGKLTHNACLVDL